MSRWSKQYTAMVPSVSINYLSIGSGGGIQQFLARTVNFAATDAPLTDDQFQRAGGPGRGSAHPVALGSEAVVYNLPSVTSKALTGNSLALIYLGTITNSNHASIAALNPGVSLHDMPITVVIDQMVAAQPTSSPTA